VPQPTTLPRAPKLYICITYLFKCWEFNYPEEAINDMKFKDVKIEVMKWVEVFVKAITSFKNTGRNFKL
jgi:hypothetical protein